MLRRSLLLGLFLLSALPASAAEAGNIVEAAIRLADKQLPLPRGEWIIVGRAAREASQETAGPYGVIRSIVLLQRKGDAVAAIAEINTNDIALNDGWDSHAACDSAPAELRLIRYSSRLDFACAFVADSRMTGGPPAWQQALDYIADHRLRLPPTMLTAGFVVSDRQDLIDNRLHFDPADFPPGAEARALLLAWAARFAPQIDAGMANRLSGAPLDGPLRAVLLSDTPELDQRLLSVEMLQRSGALGAAQALQQQQAAVAEQPRSADAEAATSSAWYSNLSGPVIDLVAAYSVTQSGPLAIAIALTEQVAHSFIQTVNQASWDRAVANATRQPAAVPKLLHIGDTDRVSGPTS